MSIKDSNETPQDDGSASPTQALPHPEPLFTIFDKRQKWLIVFIVSVAATCMPSTVYKYGQQHLALMSESLRFRIQHLLSSPSHYCR